MQASNEVSSDQIGFPEELILDPKDPLSTARSFLNWHYVQESARTLHCYQSVFYVYNGAYYDLAHSDNVRSRLYKFLEHGKIRKEIRIKNDRFEVLDSFKPNRSSVNDVLDALKAETHLNASHVPPCWLQPNGDSTAANEIIVCSNGLLHVPTRQLHRPTPDFFATHGLPVLFDLKAAKPERWLHFLSELWADDQSCIDALQEWMGYLLTSDTRQQKILLVVGPKRSGKGTIARVLKALIGEHGYCGPSMADLSTRSEFGLSTLVGKSVAVIHDARIGKGSRADIAERLLTISGEDTLNVHRKNLSDWVGKLTTRFMILTNELPGIADASGALAGRYLLLRLTRSFYGKENPQLLNRW